MSDIDLDAIEKEWRFYTENDESHPHLAYVTMEVLAKHRVPDLIARVRELEKLVAPHSQDSQQDSQQVAPVQ